jgi:endonuclease III
MKNATKHADDLKGLVKKLLKEQKPDAKPAMEPLKALVRGAMSFDVSDARAEEAIKAIEREFVDLNELRVATELEVHELLGTRYPAIEQRVALITQALNAIFEKEHTLSLERMKTVSKKDARQFLKDLPGMVPFVDAYIMLFGLDSPAVPVDALMANYLIEEEVFDEGTPLEEVQKFIEHHVKGEDSYDVYSAIRRGAGSAEPGDKKKAKAKA